jgi:hypothetical protein
MVGGGIRPPPFLAELVDMLLGNILLVAVGLFASRPRPGASPPRRNAPHGPYCMGRDSFRSTRSASAR